jgi:hypothetical protein
VIATEAVGTDGSATAGRAVDEALDLAQRYDAKVVHQRLPAGQRRAPAPRAGRRAARRHWKINPTEDVDAILRDTEEKADERAELL